MTKKVAEKLNQLLAASAPVIITPTLEHEQYYAGLVYGPAPASLLVEIGGAIESCRPQGIADEISAAATERRRANVQSSFEFDAKTGRACFYEGAARRTLILAKPLIEAILARHNADTLARYEAYRLACEQRVAVEPGE